MIDVNAYLHRWPFRRLPLDEAPSLVRKLRSLGIEQAWAGSLDALLHEDIAAVNARLADDCRRFGEGLFVPFGAVNPRLPDWREDLRRCAEDHRMPGIRLHPNYHGYALDHPDCLALLEGAAGRGLIVQVAIKMEDERVQSSVLRVPAVDAAPLPGLLGKVAGLKLVLLNAMGALSPDLQRRILAAGDASLEVAMLEGAGGVENALPSVGPERLLFGTYAPVFVPESSALKLKESGLGPEPREAIVRGNARRLLPKVPSSA